LTRKLIDKLFDAPVSVKPHSPSRGGWGFELVGNQIPKSKAQAWN